MKILNELDELQEAGVITSEVAQNIRAYLHQRKPNTTNSFLVIFGILGAVLIGLGLILILAHNWDYLSRGVKTIVAFTPLVVGQSACFWVLFRPQKTWIYESFAIFTALSVGLCIAMVHQIYNLPENNISNFIFTWILLGLPLVYVMKSKSVALFYMFGVSAYAISTQNVFNYDETDNHYFLMQTGLVIAIIPFYYRLFKTEAKNNYTAVFHWFFVITLLISIFANAREQYVFALIIILLWMFIYVGKYIQSSIYYNAYKLTAILGIVFLLFFPYYSYGFWSDFQFIAVLLFGLQLLYAYKKYWVKKEEFDWLEVFPILIVAQAYWLSIPYMFDLLGLGFGIWYLIKGVKSHRFLLINFGLIVLTYAIGQRFFDAYIPFLLKGIVFVILGMSFFVVNYLIIRKIRKNA